VDDQRRNAKSVKLKGLLENSLTLLRT